MRNYFFTLTVNILYTLQFVNFVKTVQQMHNYLFTLTLNIQFTVQFVHILYLSNQSKIIC